MSSVDTIEKSGNGMQESSPLLLHRLDLHGFLSFGVQTSSIPLGSLNLLIGPNGSGKSNLIEAISLLRATPTNLEGVIRRGGGVQEWIWKGLPDRYAMAMASFLNPKGGPLLQHSVAFTANKQSFALTQETVSTDVFQHADGLAIYYFRSQGQAPTIRTKNYDFVDLSDHYNLNESILAQRKDPEQYPEISYIAEQYSRIRIYREWQFGRNSVFREPQRADMRTDRLEEDFSNLGLFLNRLRRNPQAKNTILRHLRDIYEGVDDFDVSVEGGTVQVFFTEGNFTIPATRLSDGTLRYLCLLAILCDPTPPPLICIEEPELGLHPDILPKIADLLVEASQRTQLIVTTHSDILVDAMTEQPESVLVCEKRNGQTQINRLSKEDLAVWLETYRLGELWMRGELGGTRW